jgi:hypothetical protein
MFLCPFCTFSLRDACVTIISGSTLGASGRDLSGFQMQHRKSESRGTCVDRIHDRLTLSASRADSGFN